LNDGSWLFNEMQLKIFDIYHLLMMTVVRTSETSVYFENTRRYIPDGCHLYILHNRRRENLKSYLTLLIEETTEKEAEHYNISVSMVF
jgi:hypothetical protein